METILFNVLDIVGTIAFAISGTVAGMHRRLDMFGVIVTGTVTAIGGGVMRDVILDRLPPTAFLNPQNALLSTVVSICVFVIIHKAHRVVTEPIFVKLYTVCDALGLGMFAVVGVDAAVSAGYIDNIFLLLFVGTLTGVGGGMLRDILTNTVPSVLRSDDLYATAAVLGCVLYVMLLHTEIPQFVSALLTIIAVLGIRIASLMFRLRMPKSKIKRNSQK